MEFHEIAQQAVADMLGPQGIGRDATYRPPVGDPVAVRVHLERSAEIIGEYAQVVERRPVVTVARHQLADPAAKGEFAIGGELFQVDPAMPVLEDDGYLVRIACLEPREA